MPPRAVVWDGNLVYVGLNDPAPVDPNEQDGLAIVDVTDPAAPVLLGFRTFFRFSPQAARGGFVFGADNDLVYVDARIPASLSGATRVSGTNLVRKMAIAGDWLVVTGGSIWVVDLRQLPVLGVPIVVPGLSPCSCYDGIAINLPYAYVSWGNAWLSVIDLTQPTQPIERQRLLPGLSVGKLGTDGTKLFTSPNQSSGQAFTWSDLANPQIPSAAVPVTGPAAWLGLIRWQEIPGAEVGILPAGVGLVPVPSPQDAVILDVVGSVRRVAPAGDRLCLATATGVVMARLANDSSLEPLGMLAGAADDVVTAGNRAYAIRDGGVDIVDITSNTPRLLGTWRYSDLVQGAMALVVRDGRAFVVTGTARTYDGAPRGALCVVDLTDDPQPTTVASRPLALPGRGIVLDGNFAYLTMYGEGVRFSVFGVADPATPTAVTERLIDGYAGDVAVAGGVAYIATTAGLTMLDVGDPTRIHSLGTWGRDESPVNFTATVPLALVGHYVLIGSGTGIDVLDVTVPRSVTVTLRERTGEAPRGLRMLAAGDRTFLLCANGDLGLLAFERR